MSVFLWLVAGLLGFFAISFGWAAKKADTIDPRKGGGELVFGLVCMAMALAAAHFA